MDELNQKFPPANIRRIDARYRAEDVKRYINTRNRTGKAGEVEGYITELIVATDPETEIVYYYDFALLCPPPEPCDREMPSKDSLTSIDTSRKSK
ncbi:MAG TPA: hypothetical protein VFZ78_04910 [Flavisolibacter sp.]